jgi:hypothetical protein
MNIKRIIKEEINDFEWAGGMIDPFDYGKYLRLVFFVDGDKIEWTESKLKEVGYKESPHVNKYKERLRGSDRVAFIVNKAYNVLHFEGEKTYEITSVEEAKKKVRWLSAGDNSRFTMTIIDNPFNV